VRDVGIVPFRVEPFNDAGLPYRILKYCARPGAHRGARSRCADTWSPGRDDRRDAEAFAAAAFYQAARAPGPTSSCFYGPLAQTARSQNSPRGSELA